MIVTKTSSRIPLQVKLFKEQCYTSRILFNENITRCDFVKQHVDFLSITENAAYMRKWWKAKNCIWNEFGINSLATFSISVI